MPHSPRKPDRGFTDLTEPVQRRSGGSTLPLGAIVRVLDAPATPPVFRLSLGSCVIGSAPACDVAIDAQTVSRQHVELTVVPEGVMLRDLGSRNGCFYAGHRVEKMVLYLGARITIGTVTLAIDVDAEQLAQAPAFEGAFYHGIVGDSVASRRLFSTLARLEGSLATVLIEGESGVGKERVAQAIHRGSRAAGGPIVVVNCGAFPRELIASELFGHRRGAFSGAFDARRGAFETADGGTLFLDEIGELPLDVQPMLLRAIELGEVRPLGEDVAKQVRVRVVAATNRELETEVGAGKFRQDLFYRLAVVRVRVPPLRERPEDIAALALHFATSAGLPGLPPGMLDELRARQWPGNARELQNAIVAYAALGSLPEGRPTLRRELEPYAAAVADVRRPYAEQKDEMIDAFNRTYLKALLAHTRGNQSEAARVSGLNRTYLGRMLARYGLARTGDGEGEDD